MSKLTLGETIKHCLEVANRKEMESEFETDCVCYAMTDKEREEYKKCAAEHRQLAEWLTELKELRNSIGAVKLKDMKEAVGLLQELNTENDQLTSQLVEAKRLLKLAVEDFAKLDRENTKNKNCMMPEMDCADCPLSWDSVDCRVEPCHSWRYANEALKLIGDE